MSEPKLSQISTDPLRHDDKVPPLSDSSIESTENIGLEDSTKITSGSYGWFGLRPNFLQKFGGRPTTFLLIICACAFVQEFTVSGIVNLCVSSIEKQFRLTSTQTGAVISSYDIAFLAAAGPVSYLGGGGGAGSINNGNNKIRYLTAGMLCLGAGSLIFASPQFFSQPYEYSSFSETCVKNKEKHEVDKRTVKSSNVGPVAAFMVGNILHGLGSAPLYTLGVAYIDENTDSSSVPLYLGIYYAVSVLGPAFGFLFGGFILTIYVDSGLDLFYKTNFESGEPVKLSSDPNWVGAWWLGFTVCSIAAFTVAIPLSGFAPRLPGMFELFKVRQDTSFTGIKKQYKLAQRSNDILEPDKSNKVDRPHSYYWAKISTILSIIKKYWGIIKNIFQKKEDIKLSSQVSEDIKNYEEERDRRRLSSSMAFLGKIKGVDVKREMISLFTNVPYVFITLAGAADGFLLNAFAAFLPKYLEMQFGISSKSASLYVGVLTIPAGVLGMFLGGYLIKKFNVGVVGMFRIIFWSSLFNLLCMCALLTTCPENKLAGVNYESPSLIRSHNGDPNLIERKIEFSCNMGCHCENTYDPICGINNVMFYSACHAGCDLKGGTNESRRYKQCRCIPNLKEFKDPDKIKDLNVSKLNGGSGTLGSCSINCDSWKMIIYLSVMFIGLFLMLMIAVVAVNCTLKCVEGTENSLAMGIQWVMVRLLGTIPGPIVFGRIIDRNCLFWEIKSEILSPQQRLYLSSDINSTSLNTNPYEIEYGSCKLYTNYQMGLDLFLLTMACKLAAQLFYGIAYYSYWYYESHLSHAININLKSSHKLN